MKAGLRVVRGPDWKWGNDDTSEGHLGTVIETHNAERRAVVLWDNGKSKSYRAGQENAYDLLVLDNAQIGVRHPSVNCDECGERGIKGFRWKCSVCSNYDLCSPCYNKDKHDLSHAFLRFETNTENKSVKVAARKGSPKCEAQGIFQSATVSRGLHWRWENQDGGEGTYGFVMEIKDWEPSFRSQAGVLWANGKGFTYRLGHNGNVDLKCIKAASGGFYYKSHLPVLGKMDVEASESDLTSLLQAQLIEPFAKLLEFGQILRSLKEVAAQNHEVLKPGIRVVRGPHWKWQNQDGGEGYVGTVADIGSSEPNKPPEQCVSVIWDNGTKNTYRIGRDNSYDLLVLDNAPSGVSHKNYACDECKASPIPGIRWKCSSCFDYHLCSHCYHSNKHELSHTFWRYDNASNKRFKVPKRRDSSKVESQGIFTSAVVRRGPDWKWGDQDAAVVPTGLILSIKPWDSSESANSAAEVLWVNENQNTYRVGHQGHVDLKFETAASGGHYYKDHLPILGKTEKSPCEFQIGDIVRCCFDVDLLKILQDNHGGWIDDMAEYINLNGKVVQIDSDEDIVVLYNDGKKWYYNQDALSKVDSRTGLTRSPMDSDVVRKVLELGFERQDVQTVIFKRFSEGQNPFTSVEALVEEIFDSQHSTSSQSTSVSHTVVSENQKTDELTERGRSGRVGVTSSQSIEVDASAMSENQRLAEENRMLKEQRQCKVCMDKDACITFVPCGHLISCDECYSTLRLCPMCRAVIESTLRTFIS
ncbi:E3 ubiquitin-protein ligase MIB1 [Biomphalaria glabrata]|nr:E3 ubiquitin-protein ligase MIB1 [Biomphalaria glabrata]